MVRVLPELHLTSLRRVNPTCVDIFYLWESLASGRWSPLSNKPAVHRKTVVTRNNRSPALRAAYIVRSLLEEVGDPFWDQRTLHGACGVGSMYLKYALDALNVEATYVTGVFEVEGDIHLSNDGTATQKIHRMNHCWVRVGGTIIDVTATQFGIPERVHVQAVDAPYFSGMHVCPAERYHMDRNKVRSVRAAGHHIATAIRNNVEPNKEYLHANVSAEFL